MSPALSAFQTFINDLLNASIYANWLKGAKKDGPLWTTYYKEILAGQSPSPPAMNTAFGKALVEVGVIVLLQNQPPPPPPPPPSQSAFYGDAEYGVSEYGQ